MQSKLTHDSQAGAAVYSPLVLKVYDWWVLGVSNQWAWRCPTRSVLLPFFQQHLGVNHLDVGVGTGYYLAHSAFAPEQKITLLDLNANSLASACARIADVGPLLIQENILKPSGALGDLCFDSISLFYVLHCLPGRMEEKAAAVFDLLHRHLSADGTLYGATILGGDQVAHNYFGRRLMKLYQRKGIFGNQHDSLEDLESVLSRYFSMVSVRQYGRVALFSAKHPVQEGRMG
ncbi:class I SAM-dependent methyltransferase [Chromobacterium haemolyticum]|uniref:class I SAM-dependent methyltransferase n=1 Tax=Chromobacterium haemolyticum TaxID=394935 RepID=UPI00307D9877